MFKLQSIEITGFKSFADRTEVVFTGDGITAVVGPNGCGKCVSGDTLVTLADGRDVPIRELVNAALEDSCATESLDDGTLTRENPHGAEIVSLNPQTLRLERRPVAAFIKRSATPHLLRVRTRSGREVTATPYHPLFTLEGGRLRALKAEELKVGVRLALPRRLPTMASASGELSPREVLGRFNAEDRVYVPSSPSLCAWAKEGRTQHGSWSAFAHAADVSPMRLKCLLDGQAIGTGTLDRLAATIDAAPPLDGNLKSHGSGQMHLPASFSPDLARFLGLLVAEGRNTLANQVWFVNSDRQVNDEYERLAHELFGVAVSRRNYKSCAEDSLIYSRTLGVALERLFDFPVNSTSKDKQIPAGIFTADATTQWAFLSGLFEGDAYICARAQASALGGARRPHAYIEYATASERLARGVVALLLRLGVFATLRPKQKYATNTVAQRRRTYYSVFIYGSNQLRHVARHLSFVGAKRHALETLRDLEPAANPNHDLVPDAAPLVKEAARQAGVNIKRSRAECPKLAAYREARCEASRDGLHEVARYIEAHGATPDAARDTLDRLAVLSSSDVYWDEIVQIEQVAPPDEWVYDLSVAGTHNFVAGNIIVHNSNVADAIAWVLGEQRAKALRGGEMKDVIFQGTRTRKAGGMAEVVLHLTRDEDAPDEEQIDDIDHRLEELDDEQTEFDSEDPRFKSLTNGANAEGATATAGDATSDAIDLASLDATNITAGSATPEENTGGDASSGETAMARLARGRRHWRPATRTLDFAPGETVSVTRRLYRSGESEYLLNNRTCRLRDIQDLFSGTGLAGAHYAIIEQGRIGQILSAKPTDRRALIEDAAGITKFRVRQRAAEARLEGARANLNRVTDIVAEVERQVGSLRRQAAKARRYTAMRDELRALLRDVYRADYEQLTRSLAELHHALGEITAEENRLEIELGASEAAVRDSTAHARAAEEQLAEARAAAADAALQRDRREREYAYQQEQLVALERRIASLAHDSEAISERLVTLRREADGARENEEELRAVGEAAAELLQAAERAYLESIADVAAAEAEVERLRAEHLHHTAAAERLAEIGRQLEAALERLRTQAAGLAREGERAHAAHETAKREAARLAAEMETARLRLSALVRERDAAAVTVTEAREAAVTLATEHTRIQNEFERVRHRLRALTELDARHAHYSEAVQRIFSEENKAFTHRGTLADVLRVEPQWERAVESVFGDHLQAVIVPTPEDALRAAAWLHADGLGRANFIVAGLHGGSVDEDEVVKGDMKRTRRAGKITDESSGNGNPESSGARLGELLGAPPEIVAALERALVREMNARVVPDLDEAMTLSLNTGETFVTLEGEFVAGGALLGAGGAGVPGVAAGLLAFKREMRELEEHAVELEAAAVFAEGQATDATRRVSELEDAVVILNEAIGRAEREQVTCEMNHAGLLGEIERTERHLRVVASDAARLDEEIAELTERRERAEREAATAEAARQDISEQVTLTAESLTERRRAAGIESERLSEQRATAATAAERRRAAAQELRRAENEIADLQRRFERHQTEIKESRARHDELRRSIGDIEQQSTQNETSEASQTETIARLNAELQRARDAADQASSDYSERTRGLAAIRDRRHAFEVNQASAQARLNYLHEACMTELNQPLEELTATTAEDSAETSDFSLEDARARVEELRARLESFGGVNMMALEELTEAEERFTFLTTQRKDIVEGIYSTEEALREIKRRSRDRFRHAFEAINSNFSSLFAELFGGGRGEMSLIDTQDVLESGIDIIAQPPGKRLQSVLLLSGGEKAMAALALLLAVFRYRPSPFCLLDEVDAPLDEANIGRFTNKIIEMSERTQFIVITHNKRTMEVARALYGVTMEEAGVSKLVSAKFE